MLPYTVLRPVRRDARRRPAAARRRGQHGRRTADDLPPGLPAAGRPRPGQRGTAQLHPVPGLLHHPGPDGRPQADHGRRAHQPAGDEAEPVERRGRARRRPAARHLRRTVAAQACRSTRRQCRRRGAHHDRPAQHLDRTDRARHQRHPDPAIPGVADRRHHRHLLRQDAFGAFPSGGLDPELVRGRVRQRQQVARRAVAQRAGRLHHHRVLTDPGDHRGDRADPQRAAPALGGLRARPRARC